MNREQFLQLAAKHKLPHVGEQLFSTTVPGLRALEGALREPTPTDRTFIGGAPKPMPLNWPSFQDKPMAFLGQVDSSSLPVGVCPVPLAPGILQFFVPSETDTIYGEPQGRFGRVLYCAFERDIPDCAVATIPHEPFPKRSFDWEVFPTLYGSSPDRGDPWLPEQAQQFDLSHDPACDNYFDLWYEVYSKGSGVERVQMFGFANEQQEIMEPEVELRSQSRSVDEFRSVDKFDFLKRNPHIFRKWVLLFALNSVCEYIAPAGGTYYYWITREDLANANFDNVWMCFQCS